MKVALVIPAAGSGQRLGRREPKALVDIAGEPLLKRTLARLAEAGEFWETLVLAPADAIASFEAIAQQAPPSLGPVRVHAGGATRQASVAEGVRRLGAEATIVCVHDAARPLVAPDTVRRVLDAAARDGAATVASRPADSVREDRDDGRSVALDRSRLWLVETPQAFRRDVFERAHRAAAQGGIVYTDDASLVEAIGQPVRIVESTGRNWKVTFETDLWLAEQLLREG